MLANFLRGAGLEVPVYKEGTPQGEYLLVGAFEPTQWGSGMSDIMEWVYKGHTLIIVDNPERWAEFLSDKEVLEYRGSKELGKSWYGGNFFNREHPLFEGLPVDCAFNWEYQCFATYNRRRIGLRCENGETIVEYAGYVPTCVGEGGYGDYLEFEIDSSSNIPNWEFDQEKLDELMMESGSEFYENR